LDRHFVEHEDLVETDLDVIVELRNDVNAAEPFAMLSAWYACSFAMSLCNTRCIRQGIATPRPVVVNSV
jgi:hypothetical protein